MVSVDVRQRYMDEIRAAAGIDSQALLEAFGRVPREHFLGSGPWRILTLPAPAQTRPQSFAVSDAGELYRNVAVVVDESRNLTNGNPGTLAPWLDALDLAPGKSVFHLGCGTGYYSAIIAEMVGPGGRVTAVETDPALAGMARHNLASWPHVEVVEADGGTIEVGSRDAVLINAGVTHPAASWLDSLRWHGQLVVPLTVEFGMPHVGKGLVLHVTRVNSGCAARFLSVPVMIYSCTSVRDASMGRLLGQALLRGGFACVQSLRRDGHEQETACWLHAPGFCLSTAPAV